jgi:hypothetical protein
MRIYVIATFDRATDKFLCNQKAYALRLQADLVAREQNDAQLDYYCIVTIVQLHNADHGFNPRTHSKGEPRMDELVEKHVTAQWTAEERLEAVKDILVHLSELPIIEHLPDVRGRIQSALIVAHFPASMLERNIIQIHKDRGKE